jgi:hypothetical protein
MFLAVAGVGGNRTSAAGTAGAKADLSMAADYLDEEEKSPLCDGDYEAEVIELDIEKQKLGDFVRHLNEKYGANIALDPKLGDITFSMSKVRGKWSTLLKIIMEQNRLKKECKEGVARIRRRK